MTSATRHSQATPPLGSLRTLWPFVRRHAGLLAAWLAALVCSSAATLGLPVTFRVMIDQGFTQSGAAIDRALTLAAQRLAVSCAAGGCVKRQSCRQGKSR